MAEVQFPLGVEAIALFGDGRGDDFDRWPRQAFQHRLDVLGPDQDFAHRADDLIADLGVEHGQGVEPVLRHQSVAHAGRMQRHAADSPARILAQNGVDEGRLVAAVKGAGPEMHHTDCDSGRIIGGTISMGDGEGRQV